MIGVAAVTLVTAFALWTAIGYGGSVLLGLLPIATLIAALMANTLERAGWAFGLTAATITGMLAAVFVALSPDLLRASNPAFSLTIANASSTPLTLRT